MYCGTNPTALLNQRQLAEALFRLMEQKPFSAISVSELCRAASISRQTFYSLFDSKESVVTYTLTERCCYAPETAGEDFDPESVESLFIMVEEAGSASNYARIIAVTEDGAKNAVVDLGEYSDYFNRYGRIVTGIAG